VKGYLFWEAFGVTHAYVGCLHLLHRIKKLGGGWELWKVGSGCCCLGFLLKQRAYAFRQVLKKSVHPLNSSGAGGLLRLGCGSVAKSFSSMHEVWVLSQHLKIKHRPLHFFALNEKRFREVKISPRFPIPFSVSH
jgi:hypothetical protein